MNWFGSKNDMNVPMEKYSFIWSKSFDRRDFSPNGDFPNDKIAQKYITINYAEPKVVKVFACS